VNSRLFSVKVIDCSPSMSRVSPVTPYGFVVETLTPRLDMPDCMIDTLEPVSTIRLLCLPSISTEMMGVPSSNVRGTGDFTAALSGGSSLEELPSSSPLIRFPDFSVSYWLPKCLRDEVCHPGNVNASSVHSGSSYLVYSKVLKFSSVWSDVL
jgi:hypothetical protein